MFEELHAPSPLSDKCLNSSSSINGKGDLYYTQVKYLRRAKNAPKGTVLPTNEKNLFITLDKERLKRIETQQKNEDKTMLI